MMYYKSFIANIDVLIDPGRDTKKLYENIPKVTAFITEIIGSLIGNGRILECNAPKLKVYYDNTSNTLVCVPMDYRTMYMSLTNKYNLADTVHYDNFNKLMATEPEFVEDIGEQHRRRVRKAELKSLSHSPDLSYYTTMFNLHDIEKTSYGELVDTLIMDFTLHNGKDKNYKFEVFQESVYYMIKRIDTLYGISYGKLDADHVWRTIFSNTIRQFGIAKFRVKCMSTKFRNLGDLYTPENLAKRTKTYHYEKKKPIQSVLVKSERDVMLEFMGLGKRFNKKQLKKKFRKLAIKYHPDKGGDAVKFLYLKKCYDTLQ